MPSIRYPSTEFPALTGFTVPIPETWQPDPTMGTQFAARPHTPPQGFTPNIIGTVRRAATGALHNQRTELDQRATQLPDYAERGRAETTVDGFPAYHIEYAYRHHGTITIAQMITLVEVSHPHAVDIIQLTATCAGDQTADYWDTFRLMHADLTVQPHG